MPEQTDLKRKSWWGILQPDRMAQIDSPKLPNQELPYGYGEKAKTLSRASLDSPPAVAVGGNSNGSSHSNNGQPDESAPTLRRASSKLDMFKRQGLAKKASKSKFATVTATTSPWSTTATSLHHLHQHEYNGADGQVPKAVTGVNGVATSTLPKAGLSESVSQYDFGQYDRWYTDDLNNDKMIFSVVEQQEPDGKVHERDVAYSIRVECSSKILLLSRRISDFLDLDEKVKVQFPKARPALPLLDDRRKSFLVTTRQFFFPRKNTAEKLEAYLRKIVSHPPLCQSEILQEFLAVSGEGDLMHAKDNKSHLRNPSLGPSTPSTQLSMEDLATMGESHHFGDEFQPSTPWQQHVNNYNGGGYQPQMPPLPPPPQQQHHDYQQNYHLLVQQQSQGNSQLPPLPPSGQSFYPQSPQQTLVGDSYGVPRGRGGKTRPAIPAQLQQPGLQVPQEQLPPLNRKVSVKDFQFVTVLGKGCMGKVILVREIQSKKLFALKTISKEWVILQREIEHTKSERDILANVAKISHPFLIKLRHSFQDHAQLYMVLDFYPGGDIATQLSKWHKFEPSRCLFYTTEIVLGIEELHRLGIVYRDLKPENILLAMDGHIVLTDFGLSKQFRSPNGSNNGYINNEKTSTFCGTAEYLAPEILMAHEYSYEVDWWSLGTLLYEMLSGITPFWADNHAIMYRRVLEDDLEFPEGIDPDAMSFISGLLERDPVRRLGYGSNGARIVKRHPYFKGIDWHQALQRRLPCPYVPELTSEEDLRNFDESFLTMTPRVSPGNHTLSNSIQNCFQGYSYTMASSALPAGGGTLPRTDSKMQNTPGAAGAVSVQNSYKEHQKNHGSNPHQGSYRGGMHSHQGHPGINGTTQQNQQQQPIRAAGSADASKSSNPQAPPLMNNGGITLEHMTDIDLHEDDDDDVVMQDGQDGDMEDDEEYHYENGQPDPDRVHENLFGYRPGGHAMATGAYGQYDQYHPQYDETMMSVDPNLQLPLPQAIPRSGTSTDSARSSSKYGASHRNNSGGSSSGYIPPSAAIAGVEVKGQATVDMHVRRSSSANSTSAIAALKSCSSSVARHSVHLTGLNIINGGPGSNGDTGSMSSPGSPMTPTFASTNGHGGMSSPSASSIKALASSYSPVLPSVPDETAAAAGAPGNGRVIALAETMRSSSNTSAADILRGYSDASASSGGPRHNSTSSSRSSDTIGRRLSRSFL